MSNKTEKVNEVIAFIERFPNETKKFYAENNGVISNKTFYEWCKKGLITTPTTEDIVDNIFQECDEDKEYSVYIHLLPNNTIYIGQTRQDLNARWGYGSGYRKNSLFYLNIKKYGWDNIDHLLVKGGLSKKEADELETTLINFYSSNEISTGRVVLNLKENENK